MRAALVGLPLISLGAALRLRDISSMEFKADERNALDLGIRLLDARPWSSTQPWPTHGLLSSHNVANAPLFNWIVAAAWAASHDPVAVARVVAIVNALCLYPLWRWARRRTDERRALLTLAIAAASPFAVLFSRKIWSQDLLLPGVVAALWATEWLRSERPWRGVLLLGVATLVMGQLHQSGAIALALLPLAIAVQWAVDRRERREQLCIKPPSGGEIAALAVLIAANLFFWLPYFGYLVTVPADVIAHRPKLDAMTLQFLRRVAGQVRPIDLFYFFDRDRDDFLRSTVRAGFYYGSVALGTPLAVYGIWRWLRAPFTLPIVGVWWWSMIALFTIAKIPSYPFYVLALAPLPALLAAGAFDGRMPRWLERTATVWRIGYTASLLGLTLVTESWIAHRGGSMGDYGITYRVVDAEARAAESVTLDTPFSVHRSDGGFVPSDLSLPCHAASDEVRWVARQVHHRAIEPHPILVCDRWSEQHDGVVYVWAVRRGDASARGRGTGH
jgi:hypothetical protein